MTENLFLLRYLLGLWRINSISIWLQFKNKVYIDKSNDRVNKCNKKYHKTQKMKPNDVKSSTYIDFDVESNDEDHKFKVSNYVKISKYKTFFAEEYTPNWSGEVLVIEKVTNNLFWTYVISDLNGEGNSLTFFEKELQKTN